jgi:hypothetical protein
MNALLIVTCFLVVATLATLAFFAFVMSKAVQALRDIAREALLSTKATDASELAQTAAFAHEAQVVRDNNLQVPPEARPVEGEHPEQPNKVMMEDGTILSVLRPFM